MKISVQQLEAAVAVYEEGTFSKAAKRMHVSQPALSMQIKALEDFLKFALFNRASRTIQATPKGLTFIQYAKAVLTEYKKLATLIESQSNEDPKGVLRIGVIPTIAPYLLPSLLPLLRKKFPDLKVECKELKTSTLLDAIAKDQCDLGILAGPIQHASLETSTLYYEKFAVYLSEELAESHDKLKSLTDLPKEQILLLEEGHCMRNQSLAICNWADNSHYSLQSGSLETLIRLCDSNLGWTILPELTILQMTPDQMDKVRYVKGDGFYREIISIHSRYAYKPTAIHAAIETIKECVSPKLLVQPQGQLIEVI